MDRQTNGQADGWNDRRMEKEIYKSKHKKVNIKSKYIKVFSISCSH